MAVELPSQGDDDAGSRADRRRILIVIRHTDGTIRNRESSVVSSGAIRQADPGTSRLGNEDHSRTSGYYEPMDKTVARLNIEHLRRLLEAETDAAKLAMVRRLLAEEEEKLYISLAGETKKDA